MEPRLPERGERESDAHGIFIIVVVGHEQGNHAHGRDRDDDQRGANLTTELGLFAHGLGRALGDLSLRCDRSGDQRRRSHSWEEITKFHTQLPFRSGPKFLRRDGLYAKTFPAVTQFF
jgi:hypothetical protein